jgi:hypothetical protein
VDFTPKLTFMFDGSISYYTRNLKDTAAVELKRNGSSIIQYLMPINMTTAYYTAFKTSLAYRFTNNIRAFVEYRRIDPEYQSFGAYFFNNDVAAFTFNANANLLKNKLILRGSIGSQRDNLGNTKKHTSRRTVGSAAATVNFTQSLGIDLNYSNFSTNQSAGRTPLVDSLRLFQVNKTMSIMPRFTKATTNLSHFVMLNYNLMQLDDKNKRTSQQTETKTSILAANYSLGLLKTRTNISLGANYTTVENNMYQGNMYSGTAGLAQAVFKNKLSLNLTGAYMLNQVGGNDGTTLTGNLSATFRPHPKHAFNLGVYYIDNSYSGTTTSPSFNETRGEIRYAYTF